MGNLSRRRRQACSTSSGSGLSHGEPSRDFLGTQRRCTRVRGQVDDLQAVLKAAKERYPHKPVILCGHSLGALIAVRTALRDQTQACDLLPSRTQFLTPAPSLPVRERRLFLQC